MTTAATTTRDADTLVILAQLIPHGQHVRSEVEGSAAGQATAEERPEAAVNGVLRRFDKRQRASATPQAFGWIKAIYGNAIEYAGQKQALEGGIMIGTFMFVPGGVVGFAGCIALLVQASDLWFSWVMFIPGIAAMLLFTYWMTLFPLRHVWRTPKDLPLIFDRANRRVYRMAQQIQPGLGGWPNPGR